MMMKKKQQQKTGKQKRLLYHTVLTVDAVLSRCPAVVNQSLSPCYSVCPKHLCATTSLTSVLSHKLNDEIDLAPHTTRAHHNNIQ